MNEIRKILAILPGRRKIQLFWIQCFIVVVAFFEMIGFSAIAPFIGMLSDPSIIQSNRFLNAINLKLAPLPQSSFIVYFGVFTVFLILLSNILILIRQYVMTKYFYVLQRQLTLSMRDYYISREYTFHLNTNSANLLNKTVVEVQKVVHGILRPFVLANAQFFTIAFFIVGIFLVDPSTGFAIAVVITLIYLIVFFAFRDKLVSNSQMLSKSSKDRIRILQESLGGIKEIKLIGNDRFYARSFRVSMDKLTDLAIKNVLITDCPRYVIEGILFSSVVILVLFFYNASGQDFSSIIVTLSFVAIAGYKSLPAANIVYRSLAQIKGASGSLDVIYDDLLAVSNLTSATISEQKGKLDFTDAIALKDIDYEYIEGKKILDKLSLRISKHSTVGVVGPSGAGKTTIIDVLLGLLAPDEGSIDIDGITVSADNMRLWQNLVGYVPQTVFLGDTSIRENIAFGIDPNAIEDETVIKASKMACLHDFVETLDAGYDTLIGEQGAQLSGGQRQRIAIARALYRDVEVLVFDEATSSLDGVTEKAIMESIHSLSSEKTLIIVAHRISTLKEADQIYFIESGKVVDSGTYSSLMEKNAVFREMSGLDHQHS